MLRFWRRQQRINLALEGGGAHGAFSWGVLDRLLEEPGLEIGWISGTSAGAVNAVALAAGLAEGNGANARAKLRAVWEAVAKAGVPDLMRFNPWLAGLSRSQTLAQVASLFSPYDFNPLGFDPLRKLLEAHVDFALLRTAPGPELLIAATDVATGRPRLFRRRELIVECVLASACLPTLHHAVSVDGRAYWDGGFSANPDLITLARESPVADTLIVKLNPMIVESLPTSAREISARINHITFNQPMLRDVEVIESIRRNTTRWPRRGPCGRPAPVPAPFSFDRGRSLHQRPVAGKQGQTRPRAPRPPVRRWPRRNREVVGPAPHGHRACRQRRPRRAFPGRASHGSDDPQAGAKATRGGGVTARRDRQGVIDQG